MDDRKEFAELRSQFIDRMTNSKELRALGTEYLEKTVPYSLTYAYDWLGVPIIQYPQDIIALQEIVWRIKPRAIVETGIARGGSVVFFASLLELIGDDGLVVGVDIDIRPHNRDSIESHKLASRIELVEGSSIDAATVESVRNIVGDRGPVIVNLDSMHTHDHVLEELKLYSSFVPLGSYIVVSDTMIEEMPKGFYGDRPWDVGNNPKTAVYEFLKDNSDFEIDKSIAGKLVATCNHDGYLKRVK